MVQNNHICISIEHINVQKVYQVMIKTIKKYICYVQNGDFSNSYCTE